MDQLPNDISPLEARERLYKQAERKNFKVETNKNWTTAEVKQAGERWGRALGGILYDPEQRQEVMRMVEFLAKDPRAAIGEFSSGLTQIPDANAPAERRKDFVLRMIDERGKRAMFLFQTGVSEYLRSQGGVSGQNYAESQLWWTDTFEMLQAARRTIKTQEIPDRPDQVLRQNPDKEDQYKEGFIRGLNNEVSKHRVPTATDRRATEWIIPPNRVEIQAEEKRRKDHLTRLGREGAAEQSKVLYSVEGREDLDKLREWLDKAWNQDEPTWKTRLNTWFPKIFNFEEKQSERERKFNRILTQYEAKGKNIYDYDKELHWKLKSAIEDETDNPTTAGELLEKWEKKKLKEMGVAKKYELASDEVRKGMAMAFLDQQQQEESFFIAGIPWQTDWKIYTDSFAKEWDRKAKLSGVPRRMTVLVPQAQMVS